MEALAEQTGVSRAMLSDIERGLKNPTIKVVSQIAEGLGCTVSQLIGEQTTDPVVLVRKAERQRLVDPETEVERSLLAPSLVRRGLELVWYQVPPGRSTGVFPAHRPGVVEHITVLQGQLHCSLAGRTEVLEVGDSIFFPANIAHSFHNPGSEPCHYLLLIDSSQASSG
ncbi:helix-turn-helix transcriptional regulator [Leptolyngbya sp. FACHB-261]|nr:helix-turn-helix transcriptional regulator [Leptolyngbya sp. FACHB-261]